MPFDPVDRAGAGYQAFTVPEEWVTGAGGVATEDILLLEFVDQTLTV